MDTSKAHGIVEEDLALLKLIELSLWVLIDDILFLGLRCRRRGAGGTMTLIAKSVIVNVAHQRLKYNEQRKRESE